MVFFLIKPGAKQGVEEVLPRLVVSCNAVVLTADCPILQGDGPDVTHVRPEIVSQHKSANDL